MSTTPSDARPRLVVVGSGWAGFYVAEKVNLSIYDVTIISPRRTSAYTPLLASAAVGLFNFYLAEESVRSKSRRGLRFLKANVTDVDFDGQICKCAPAFDEEPELASQEFSVRYDILVLAPGCIPNTFGTPGVEENSIFIKNVSDAMKVRKRLFDLLEMASLPAVSEERTRELLHIAVVGGGPTGIELCAELDDLAQAELKDLYPEVVPHLTISVYDVAPHILSAYDAKLHEYATTQLIKRHIDVATNTHIEKVDEDALYIKEQGRVPYGMLIWATGNKNIPLIEKIDLRLPGKGLKRIQTDKYLRAYRASRPDEVLSSVFALGDAGDILDASLPTTAEVACQKAKYLVDNLNLRNTAKTSQMFSKPFEYQQKQLVSYIGQRDGVIAGKEHREGWTGNSAWLAWRSGSLMWNRNWRSRLAIVITWILNAIFGKELAKM